MRNESGFSLEPENKRQSQDVRDEKTPNQVESGFLPQEKLLEFGVVKEGEDTLGAFKRVVDSLAEFDVKYSDKKSSAAFMDELFEMMKDRRVVPSTVMLMNAGRRNEVPLAACTVPQVDLKGDLDKVKGIVDSLHFSGMGTGFNFDDIENPIPIIEYLNNIGVSLLESDRHLRPVGNMGVLSITHPKIIDFINAKREKTNAKWVFNFSVSIKDEDLEKIKQGKNITKKDGEEVPSGELLDEMAKSIYSSGEPGLVFIDRLNKDNQVPNSGEYKSVAPCGEVGLVEGETCQFSYVNLGRFIKKNKVDYPELEKAVRATIRFLDDSVDYNISKYKDGLNKDVAEEKRRVGLGVCGFADLLSELGISYGSEKGRKLAESVFSFINFVSKEESSDLARKRGAFGAFAGSKYTTEESIILKYADRETDTVSRKMWMQLDKKIRKYGIRNCATISIPPTSRSSLIIGASQSIEPHFSEMLKISPEEQVLTIASIQKFTDESISKTVNISESSSVGDIKKVILMAIESNLKGITIYRDKSRQFQPVKI